MQQYITLPNSEIERRIAEYIHSERDRKIMRLKLIDGKTYEQVAEIIDMTPRHIQNIVRRYRQTIMPESRNFTEICFS